MSTRMMLELKYIDSTEVTIHLDAMLLHLGSAGSYASPDWLGRQNENDPFTEFGHKLREQLETLIGVHVMYSQYGFMAQVPAVFDLVDVLFDILLKVTLAVDDDILFATTLGDDAFIKPEFITNPSRLPFGENINTALVELRQRESRAITEAEDTIERLTRTLEEFRQSSQRQFM